MVAYAFNPAQFAPSYGGGDTLGPGTHPVVISGHTLKPTQDGNNGYIALTLTAIDGPQKGCSKTDRLNVHHTNSDTVRIANQQLSAYCAVTGTGPITDLDQLNNKPFVVIIAPQPGSDKYTDVVSIKTMDGLSPQEASQRGPQGGGGNAPAGFGAGGNMPPNNNGGAPQGGGFGGGQQQGGAPAGGGGWSAAPGADATGGQGGGGAPAGGGWGQAAGGGQAGGGGAPAGGGWAQGGGAAAGGGGWGHQA